MDGLNQPSAAPDRGGGLAMELSHASVAVEQLGWVLGSVPKRDSLLHPVSGAGKALDAGSCAQGGRTRARSLFTSLLLNLKCRMVRRWWMGKGRPSPADARLGRPEYRSVQAGAGAVWTGTSVNPPTAVACYLRTAASVRLRASRFGLRCRLWRAPRYRLPNHEARGRDPRLADKE